MERFSAFGEVMGRKAGERRKGRRQKDRRQHRRRWREAEAAERKGLRVQWDDIRRRLANLRRAERIGRPRKRKESERENFLKKPFRFARGLLEEKTSGDA